MSRPSQPESDIYFCLPVDDLAVRTALARAGRDLPAVNPDKYHLTLRYIKRVDQLAADSLISAAKSICRAHRPFSLTLDQPGDIPSINCYRPDASQPLMDLQADIDRVVVGLGFPAADYDYNPHITLGRRPDKPVWAVEPASWRVDQIELRRSDKNSEVNPRLAKFALGQAGQ